ncbi:MAG: glutamate 5-kinase [Candidatus Firestonebacteria bacterium]
MVNKIVIKIGTNLLTDREKGINLTRLESMAESISYFKDKIFVIVSSGAIGAGVSALKLKEVPKTIPEKQATAAVGQPLLMSAYEHSFRKFGKNVAQILLTKDDFTNRKRYCNAKNTFSALFNKNVIPIVNENDTVAVEEIKVGDNDNIAALVANLIEADLLIILSNVDGFYSKSGLIPIIEKITPDIERLAKKSTDRLSTGGMFTKIQAAKKCVSAGISVIMANGNTPNIVKNILGENFKGTLFLSKKSKLSYKDKWIAFVSNVKGDIIIDNGAKEAILKKGKSLLPSGILNVTGNFKVRDVVNIVDSNGNEIAKGVTNYSSADILKIKGKKTSEIEKILQSKSGDEIIHRNNLVIV